MTITAYLRAALQAALRNMEGVPDDFVPELEKPKDEGHGDWSTNCAMKLARHLRRAPMAIAEALTQHFELDPKRIAQCNVARPGFINFTLATDYLYDALRACLKAGTEYGRGDAGTGKRALVEFVSANPTGPLTVGHGRNAVLGDCIASLLEWSGYEVEREYYFNDAGRQMRVLGASLRSRYQQVLHAQGELGDPSYETQTLLDGTGSPVEVPASFPSDGYLGAYLVRVAENLFGKVGSAWRTEGRLEPFIDAGKEAIFQDIRRTLEALGIRMDTYFNEHSLYQSGALEATLEALDKAGTVYRKDGAVWFKTSSLGKEQDTVLVKQSGEPTYRLPDIAYHCDKLSRGYDTCIDVFGADHIATYPDILSALRVMGNDADKVEVIIYQFVTLLRGGKEIKMSTRKANFVTLDDLVDEVGSDVTRYFFLMRSAGKHLEFDLDLAKEASDKNPVFYLQYAHARICSVLDKAGELGHGFGADAKLSVLQHEAEIALLKQIVQLPAVLADAAAAREPHRVATYLRAVAEAFSQFYHHCRIIGEQTATIEARLALATATAIVLNNGLTVLGINAPQRMDRRVDSE